VYVKEGVHPHDRLVVGVVLYIHAGVSFPRLLGGLAARCPALRETSQREKMLFDMIRNIVRCVYSCCLGCMLDMRVLLGIESLPEEQRSDGHSGRNNNRRPVRRFLSLHLLLVPCEDKNAPAEHDKAYRCEQGHLHESVPLIGSWDSTPVAEEGDYANRENQGT
jgi:hypothetical protein